MNVIGFPSTQIIYFESKLDTHGLSTVTIPVSGEYIFKTFGNGEKYECKVFESGEVIEGCKLLMNRNAPGYKEIRKVISVL